MKRRFEFTTADKRLITGKLGAKVDYEQLAPWVLKQCIGNFSVIVTEYPSGYTRTTYQLKGCTAAPDVNSLELAEEH